MESSQIIILAIIATSLATFISRFMGALTSEKVSVKSKLFQWFNCVAYSTLAALLGRMITVSYTHLRAHETGRNVGMPGLR